MSEQSAIQWTDSTWNPVTGCTKVQCQAAGVPFFFKQWGGPRPGSGGRLLDGREWDELPDGAGDR